LVIDDAGRPVIGFLSHDGDGTHRAGVALRDEAGFVVERDIAEPAGAAIPVIADDALRLLVPRSTAGEGTSRVLRRGEQWVDEGVIDGQVVEAFGLDHVYVARKRHVLHAHRAPSPAVGARARSTRSSRMLGGACTTTFVTNACSWVLTRCSCRGRRIG